MNESDIIKVTKIPITKLCADSITASVNKLVRAVQPLRHHGSMLYKLALMRSLGDEPPGSAVDGDGNDDTDKGCNEEEISHGENQGPLEPTEPDNSERVDDHNPDDGDTDDWRANWDERIERVRGLDFTDVANWEDALAVLYHKLGSGYNPKSQKYRSINEQLDPLIEDYNGHGLELVRNIVGRAHVIDTEIRERVTMMRNNLQNNFVKMSLTYAKRLKTRYMNRVSKFKSVSQSADVTPEDVNKALQALQALNIEIPEVADKAWEDAFKDRLDKELEAAKRALGTLNVEGLHRKAREVGSSPYIRTLATDFDSLQLPPKVARGTSQKLRPRSELINTHPQLFIQPYARLSKLFDRHQFQSFNAVPMTIANEPQYVLIDKRTLVRSILQFEGDENAEITPIYWRAFCQGKEKDEGLERLHHRIRKIKTRRRFRGHLPHLAELLQSRLDYYQRKYENSWDPPFRREGGEFLSVRSDGRTVHLIWNMDQDGTEHGPDALVDLDFRLHMDDIIKKLATSSGVDEDEVRTNFQTYAQKLVFWDFNKRDIFVARKFMYDDTVITLRYSQSQRNKTLQSQKHAGRLNQAAANEGINLVQGEMTDSNRQSFDLDKFGRYVAAKNEAFETLKIHYRQPFAVRAKESRYHAHKKADRELLGLINETFGSDCIHIIGHWTDAGRTAKHQQPTISIGIRDLLTSAGISWYLCDEYKTSSICPFCYSTLEKSDKKRLSSRPHQRAKGNVENVHGEKLCANEACPYSYQNRDNVATRNMYNNAVSWLTTGQGIAQLSRSRIERTIPLKGHRYSLEFLPGEGVSYMGCNKCTKADDRCECAEEKRTGTSPYIRLIVKLTDHQTLGDGQTRVVTKATVFDQTAWRLVGLPKATKGAKTRFFQDPQRQFNIVGQPQIRIDKVRPPSQPNFSWVLNEYTNVPRAT
jgi:hypothetical protein